MFFFCKNDVPRASFSKHLKSKKNLDYEKFIPSNFFDETTKTKPEMKEFLKPLKEIARGKIEKDKKQLKKNAKNRLNFTPLPTNFISCLYSYFRC